jgi:hypothetical protein
MTDEDLHVVDAMIRFGGGFVSALGKAWIRADADNERRLRAAFPEVWREYQQVAALKRANAEGREP